MTRREIAALACRILALVLIALTVYFGAASIFAGVGGAIQEFTYGGAGWRFLQFAVASFMPAMCLLAFGVFLWRFADGLACRMMPDDPTPVTGDPADATTVMSIACIAVGVFIFSLAMVSLVTRLFEVTMQQYTLTQWWQTGWWRSRLFAAIAELIWALFLILRPSGVVRLIRRMRTTAVSGPEVEHDHDDTTV